MKSVILPELGEGIEKAVVACWHADVGSRVNIDDDIVELVTDKAVFCVPASASGIVKEIYVGEGQEVKIGAMLAIIDPLNENVNPRNE